MSDKIITSWEENAEEWIKTITNESIPSRKFTNQAILDAIKKTGAKKAIDIGCGEGWLTREMTKSGIEAIGIDAISTLLDSARSKGAEDYYQITFEEIAQSKKLPKAPYDLIVFNFCIYQEKGLSDLIGNSLKQLTPSGHVLIQTLHPYFLIQQGLPYKSQWLEDSWKGLEGNFVNGHSWYARTLEDWSTLLSRIQSTKLLIKEVLNDEQKPISLILELKKK